MEKIKVSWTKDEFNAYILIYAAQTNFIETDEEKAFIESRINKTIIDKIHKENNCPSIHNNDTRWKLKNNQRIHLHIGTAEVIAKAIIFGDPIEKGHSANVLFILEKPVAAIMDSLLLVLFLINISCSSTLSPNV